MDPILIQFFGMYLLKQPISDELTKKAWATLTTNCDINVAIAMIKNAPDPMDETLRGLVLKLLL